MNAREALAFVREKGVVLVSAKGPVPTLTHEIAGGPIKGSWWGHPKGKLIFAVLSEVTDSPDVLVCRLVGGKLTLVHKRLWPAVLAAAPRLPKASLAQVTQEHTASGRHVNRIVAFPKWAPREAIGAAKRLTPDAALVALGL